MKVLLFDPFRRIAGTRALVSGLLLMGLSAVIAYYGHCHFDGVLDVHLGAPAPLWFYITEGLLAWVIAVVIFYGTALVMAGTRTRFIDIAGTMALARWPLIFAALVCLAAPPVPDPMQLSGPLLVLSLCLLAASVYMIALMYQAYCISAHLKGQKAVWSFVAALIFSEILSKLVWSQLASLLLSNS